MRKSGLLSHPNWRAATNLAESLMEQLIQARKQRGVSQSEVARRMKVPQSAIVRLEAQRHSPTLMTLTRFASAIGIGIGIEARA